MLLPEKVHGCQFQKLMELSVKCLHNILRHLFCINIRNLHESLRNIYEKFRGFICSGLSGKVTDEEDLVDNDKCY